MLRYRGKNKVLEKVKELDAFPKVPEQYVDSTPVGGTFSIITVFIIIWLINNECSHYWRSNLVFKFMPDTDLDEKLRVNIDITIAMPCSNIGADILDSTHQSVFGFGELQEEDTWFELSQEQQAAFDAVKHLNEYLREEYHSIWQLLWMRGHGSVHATIPQRKEKPNRRTDACRLHGILTLNKITGNFHITAGKSLHLPKGHIHIMFGDGRQNYSHRIHRFSFGSPANGIVYPLEGDEKITTEEDMLFQYFVDVVPTDIQTTFETTRTFQYSVRELERPISHAKGSHGVPGIFFKYDMAALKVRVYQEKEYLVTFLLRMFCSIGGIFIIIGVINTLVLTLRTILLKKAAPIAMAQKDYYDKSKPQINPLLLTPDLGIPVELLKQN